MGSDTGNVLLAAAERFCGAGAVLDVAPYGSGNVHGTYLVRRRGAADGRILLQRVNTRVFPRPDRVMHNLRAVTEHLERRVRVGSAWQVPGVLLTRDGRDHWIDPAGGFWRALRFVAGAHTIEIVRSTGEAEEVGRALGTFQSLLSDLPIDRLADTLRGFHVTPLYLHRFDRVLARWGGRGSAELDSCLRFVEERRGCVTVLEDARCRGVLPLRPIHGDPKVNNVLFDDVTGRAVCLVDLDTVKPGLVHYDIGDCLRSACNPLGEETEHWPEVRFDPDLCRAVLAGYLGAARSFLTEADREHVYEAVHLIAFELGLRFLTDYLEGNVYFRVRSEEHNLVRALVQFRLAESIEGQESVLRALVRHLR
ncbi:MAG: aminoglycoside phosphotransferase family protein [Deltaproteobacteria bacterium]|nr:aminoglycoside phosphotransferase family protein [Deltaproteobacteria bacterium]